VSYPLLPIKKHKSSISKINKKNIFSVFQLELGNRVKTISAYTIPVLEQWCEEHGVHL
jgi:hypothetical protein